MIIFVDCKWFQFQEMTRTSHCVTTFIVNLKTQCFDCANGVPNLLISDADTLCLQNVIFFAVNVVVVFFLYLTRFNELFKMLKVFVDG